MIRYVLLFCTVLYSLAGIAGDMDIPQESWAKGRMTPALIGFHWDFIDNNGKRITSGPKLMDMLEPYHGKDIVIIVRELKEEGGDVWE